MKILDSAKELSKKHRLDNRLNKAIVTSRKYSDLSESETEAFRFACLNASIVKIRYEEARNRIRKKEIRQIVISWIHEFLRDGKEHKNKEDLLKEIDRFDESAMLTPTEFFAIPDIVICECAEIFVKAFEKALGIQKAVIEAERWMEKESPLPLDFDPVFFLEHAIRLSAEKDDPNKRKQLTKCLHSIGKNEEEIVNVASTLVSVLLLRLTNAVSAMHETFEIDWADAYEKTSHIEKTLMSDPAGTYPLMDEESKTAIRREIEVIHRKTHAPERRIASLALSIAENEPDGITQIIYTDDGRKKLLYALDADGIKLPKMIPDPQGYKIILGVASISILIAAVTLGLFGPVFLTILFPCVLIFADDIIRRIKHEFVFTRPLLSLKMEDVSDQRRTLVVIPALLASVKSANTAVDNLVSYGAHEKSENIDFLLLADLKDSEQAEQEKDEEIVNAAKARIEEANQKSERQKYFFLIRNRTFLEADQIYMGYERKRGALMDLNRLLLGNGNRFSKVSSDASKLVDRYQYVLTVDMDTKILPGTIRKMIGTIAHPLNADFAIIQPRMENTGLLKHNLFSSMMAGYGGTDHYDVCASDFYQDLTGEGQYSGKGIYNIKSFHEKTAEAFQENTILSHDMIEGILSKAGYAGNIVMYESFPETTAAYYKRLDRWTRGDWQLIHYLFGRLRLNALARWKIISNLIRSLKNASLLAGIILSVWMNENTLLAGLIALHFLPVALNGFGAMKPCLLQFALLPVSAYTEVKAALTALIRLYITKQKRLEWVTAAESEKTGKTLNYPSILSAIFIIPGLFSGELWLPSVIIGTVFALGKDFVDSFDRLFRNEAIQASDYTYLTDLSKRMWRYFEKHVPMSGSGFPPDNVQIDPPIGEQARTSPTNIGMYLISVICARELGLIEESEMISRISLTLSSIKQIETWNGLAYNWYDIHTLQPVHPKYVSSVDAGNLMAAYVVVRNALKTNEPALSNEFDELIRKMEIEKLYNPKRKLFRIGVDVQNNRLSASHYDLFSSESRILSYTAIAEKGIPVSHWKRLARPFFFYRGKSALFSWSGTMFEYMMPNLLMPSACGSLMRASMKTAVMLQTQKAYEGIWGISEAGYASFDQMLNYQYKAFGIKDLALSGEANESVYAPYAILLALEHAFSKGMDSLRSMQEAGMKGEYGFFEAIDFSKKNQPRIVYSYMSHHQGMGFAAICNLLTDNSLKKLFLDHPNEQALTPLLNEKPFLKPLHERVFQKPLAELFRKEDSYKGKDEYSRYAASGSTDGHLLFSGSTLAYFESTGRSFLRKDGVYANLYRFEARDVNSSLLPEIEDASGKAKIVKCHFDSAIASYDFESDNARYKVICTINPISGALMIKVTARNETEKEMDVCVRHRFRLSLATEDMNQAHPVFSDLFVRTENIDAYGFEHARKNPDTLEYGEYLYHLTDDRMVSMEDEKIHGKYSSLVRKISLSSNEKKEIFFSLSLEKEKHTSFENLNAASFERAKMLLMGQMNAHIHFCGLSPAEYRSSDKTTVNMFSMVSKEGKGASAKSALWPIGLSGEGNILLVKLKSTGDLTFLRKAIRTHEFYRFANIKVTLIVLKVKETEYFTPLKDAALNHLLSSHLYENLGKEYGAMMIDADDLEREQIIALERMDVLRNRTDYRKEEKKNLKHVETIPTFDPDVLEGFNGYGGFLNNSNAYAINVSEHLKPPRRWSNFLVNDQFGAIVSDLGISGIYYKNSRMSRITAFENNLDDPKQSVEVKLCFDGKALSLFPGTNYSGQYTVIHDTGKSLFRVRTKEILAETTVCVHPNKQVLLINVWIENQTEREISLHSEAKVNFLMGIDERDLKFTNISAREKETVAFGCVDFEACAGFIGENAAEGGMKTTTVIKPREKQRIAFCIAACEKDVVGLFRKADAEETIRACNEYWEDRMNAVTVSTGNPLRDKLSNGFMKYQTIASRYYARFGPYQPGGAFGMRDQLQDLLSIMYFDRALSKEHILMAAARQFEKGDGLHWWHMPAIGVRTRISDDVLFLAIVTAKYVDQSGDSEILSYEIPYLKNQEIPPSQTDLYASFETTENAQSLYDHIMKAFRYTCRRGEHGLVLMGSGDWNDGMNRVGKKGKGESVWLSMFWIYAANVFKKFCKLEDKQYLEKTSEEIKNAIEEHAWDGKWYLRAFSDEGKKLGSGANEECRIDLIAQAWAALAGLDRKRVETALASVEEHLLDTDTGVVRLLYPSFTGKEGNPGYISAYPPGRRENGGQYTHAVTWLVKAYASLGNAEKAWQIFDILLPIERTNTFEKAAKYGGEPYVVSADIVDAEGAKGECGWTWYTGAAAWAVRVLYEDLLGLEIRGDQVRMKPLLKKDMDQVSIMLQKGNARYTLIGKRETNDKNDFVTMIDDGKEHVCFFSSRK